MELTLERCTLKRFSEADIANKVKWINNPLNNKYLHYDLPLEYDKTLNWFNATKGSDKRLDCTVFFDGNPVGLIGLLNIDYSNKKAEYYICLGEQAIKGKGVAKNASIILLDYAFNKLALNKIYLYTEDENIAAQKLFSKIGFRQEGILREDLIYNGRKINRLVYGLLKEDFNV